MNKRTLKKWLEQQRDATICAVREQAEKDQRSYTEERDTQFGFRAAAEEIHGLLSKAETIWEKRTEEISATHPGIMWQPGRWGTIHDQLREIDTAERLVERMQRELVDETERYEELRTAKNTVSDGGGYVDGEYLGWLASMTEVGFGANNGVYETSPDAGGTVTNTPFALYVGATNADRIKYGNGAARNWWLRSSNPSGANYERLVGADGSLGSGGALNGFWAVPGLDII
jgi:hypothetical protein